MSLALSYHKDLLCDYSAWRLPRFSWTSFRHTISDFSTITLCSLENKVVSHNHSKKVYNKTLILKSDVDLADIIEQRC